MNQARSRGIRKHHRITVLDRPRDLHTSCTLFSEAERGGIDKSVYVVPNGKNIEHFCPDLKGVMTSSCLRLTGSEEFYMPGGGTTEWYEYQVAVLLRF